MSCFCSIVLLVLPLLVSEVNSEDKSAASSASKPAEEQDFSAAKTLDAEINAKEGKRSL